MTRQTSVFRSLLTSESGGGFLLIFCAGFALIVANSIAAPVYFAGLETKVAGLSVLHWVNDALMTLFFLLVGLEIKRELLDGQLSSPRDRVLPGVAALGGMIVPASIYILFNPGGPTFGGWATPTATDIAFALGILALLGRRVPVSLKIFLTALAIIDDLGAVVMIALFYTADLSPGWLGAAAVLVGFLYVLNRRETARLAPYLLAGALLWVCVFRSGLHATLAGVLLAAAIPLRPSPGRPDDATSPLHILERRLQPWVGYLVLPIFAFANAGVSFAGMSARVLAEPVPLGIFAGLFLGKQLGVFAASWGAVRIGIADRPRGASWMQVYGVSILCGVGFTMSLFIGLLAFRDTPALQDQVKIGVIAGSVASALAGVAMLLAGWWIKAVLVARELRAQGTSTVSTASGDMSG